MKIRYKRGQHPNSHRPKDYAGQRFGMLVFIERTDKKTRNGCIIWKLRCDCGNVFEIPPRYITGANRRHKHKSDCGCIATARKIRVAKHEHKMWINIKNRAAVSKIPFNLEESDIVIPDVCPILGIPLVKSDKGRPDNNSPSLDRIVPALGYVKGNVRVISFRANKLKNNLTIPQLERIISYIKGDV